MATYPIYLDNLATTPVDPRVADAMDPYLTEAFGNPASRTHRYGHEAREAVESARRDVATLAGAEPRAIIFTSGATEAVNMAIQGVAGYYSNRGRRIITCRTEHPAVLDTCAALAGRGFDVVVLDVDTGGHLDLDALHQAISDDTILVSIMLANNEIGVIHDVAAIGRVCKEHGVLFHCDAAQALGKIVVDVEAMQIDLLSLSGHKLYGPKGIGALYCRRRDPHVRLEPILYGGGHERGFRSGTLNVPGIVGFGRACAIANRELDAEAERIHALRTNLLSQIQSNLDGVQVNSDVEQGLAGCLNLSFDGVDAMDLIECMPDVAVSTGSACTTAIPKPSHVLRALGISPERALSSIRIGLGRFNTADEIGAVACRIVESVQQLRSVPPKQNSDDRNTCLQPNPEALDRENSSPVT